MHLQYLSLTVFREYSLILNIWAPHFICHINNVLLCWCSEPKPVYAQPGQPDVDLPVSPSDAPVPSAAHDDSILR